LIIKGNPAFIAEALFLADIKYLSFFERKGLLQLTYPKTVTLQILHYPDTPAQFTVEPADKLYSPEVLFVRAVRKIKAHDIQAANKHLAQNAF
jgi:hypothetical protein